MARKNKTDAGYEAPEPRAPAIDPDQMDMFPGMNLMNVDLADIDRQNNHRHPITGDDEKIRELAESIKACGLLQPIRLYQRQPEDVREGLPRYVIGYGYRRVAAHALLGRTQILADVCEPAPAWQIQQARAMENLARKDLNTLEEMTAVVQLVAACEGDIDVAAGKLGRTRKWVQDRLYIDRLSKPIQEEVAAGAINLAHARELAKLVDHRAQEDVRRSWSHRTWSIGTPDVSIRSDVARRMRSLRETTWKLDQPFAGKPACTACPHNSANNLELFELDPSVKASPTCASAECYRHKVQAGEKLMAKALKSVAKDVQPDGKLSITIAREKAPEGLRPEMVVSELRREDSPAKRAAGITTTATGKAADKGKVETPEQKRERLARVKFDKAVQQWHEQVEKEWEAQSRKGNRLAALILADQLLPSSWERRQGKPADHRRWDGIFLAAAKVELDGLLEIFRQQLSPNQVRYIYEDLSEQYKSELAAAWGVQFPPEPKLEQFLPPPETAKPAKGKKGRKGKAAAAGMHLDDAEGGEA